MNTQKLNLNYKNSRLLLHWLKKKTVKYFHYSLETINNWSHVFLLQKLFPRAQLIYKENIRIMLWKYVYYVVMHSCLIYGFMAFPTPQKVCVIFQSANVYLPLRDSFFFIIHLQFHSIKISFWRNIKHGWTKKNSTIKILKLIPFYPW